MTKVRYQGKVLDVCESVNKDSVVLYEGLPDNPEPYVEISEELLATLERVHEDWCELPPGHQGKCEYYGDLPRKK